MYRSKYNHQFYTRRRRYLTAAVAGAIVATEAIGFGSSASLTAKGALAATAPIVFAQSAAIVGTGALDATEAVIFGESAAIVGGGALAATEPITFGESSQLVGDGALAATEAVVFGESSQLTGDGALVATEAVVFGESADLQAQSSLSATEPIIFGQSASLTATGSLNATEPMLFGESAALTDVSAASTASTPTQGSWELDKVHNRKPRPQTVVEAFQEQKRQEEKRAILQLVETREQALKETESLGLKPVFPPLELIKNDVDKELASLLRVDVEREALKKLTELRRARVQEQQEIEALLLLLVC